MYSAKTFRPLSFAITDNVTNNWGAEMRYLDWAPFFGLNARFTMGVQYFGTSQSDLNFPDVQEDRGAKTKDQVNTATNVGIDAVTLDHPNSRFFLPGDGRAFYGRINWRWR